MVSGDVIHTRPEPAAFHPTAATIFANGTPHNTTSRKPNIAGLPTWIYTMISVYLAVNLTILLSKARLTKSKSPSFRDRNVFGKTLNVSRVFAAYFISFQFLYQSFSSKIEVMPGVNCNWFRKADVCLYWASIAVIYAVLWLRQRVIYGKPTLSHITTKTTVMLSNAVGIMIILLPVLNCAIFSVALFFKKHHGEVCPINYYFGKDDLVTAGEYVVPILLPATLMWLFVWPLLRYHFNTELQSSADVCVMAAIKKIAILSTACLITDMMAMACNKHCDGHLGFTGRQTSIFVNILCLHLSFSDWKQVIIPCLPNVSKSKECTVVRASWAATNELSITNEK